MESETNPTLESVAEAVADGLPVDWDGLHAARPEVEEHLTHLRLLQDIIAAHRAVPTPPGDQDPT